jgi:hypothetical protein
MSNQPHGKYEVHPNGLVIDTTTGEVVADAGEAEARDEYSELRQHLLSYSNRLSNDELVGVLGRLMTHVGLDSHGADPRSLELEARLGPIIADMNQLSAPPIQQLGIFLHALYAWHCAGTLSEEDDIPLHDVLTGTVPVNHLLDRITNLPV